MAIRSQPSQPSLRRFVSSFGQRRLSLRGDVLTTPLPARPDQFVEFYLGERYGISRDGARPGLAPATAVVGPQRRPDIRLHMSGEIDVFTIRFQPTGFNRLFGIPMPALVDQGVGIGDVLGRAAAGLEDTVRRASGFAARVAAAERWLLDASERAGPPTVLDRAARLLARSRGRIRIDAIAAGTGLSARHFHRRFVDEVGVPPKFYARAMRLDHALDARRRQPGRGWTQIVYDAGYADQAHFIRDCRALTGAAPTDWLTRQAGVAETFNPGTANPT